MKNRRNYYRLLQVQPDAPLEVIRGSYRALMRKLKLHPDLGGSHWNATVINEAYETLSNPKSRAEYDRKLFEQYTKRSIEPENSEKTPLITIFCPFCKRPLARKAAPGERCASCRSPLESPSPSERKEDRASRRAVRRTSRAEQVFYYTSWPQKPSIARMLDLSTKGMRLLCREPLRPGTTIKISSPFIKATARVTNCQEKIEDGKKLFSAGLSFLAVSFEGSSGSIVSTTA